MTDHTPSLDSLNSHRKVYDTIYGFISFPKLIWEFVDTPHFQRLRNIKQLGCLSWVFPGAMHSRFEHSLGTAHLAQKYITTLIQKHNSPTITQDVYEAYHTKDKSRYISAKDQAIFTVTLAGLLHDVGHGPFSHLFDLKVVREINNQKWEHEIASLFLIDDMYKYVMKEIQKLPEGQDKKFVNWFDSTKDRVKSLIIGKITKPDYKLTQQGLKNVGEKYVKNLPQQVMTAFEQQLGIRSWEFEIVSNRLTGIDVDKLDYFRRDAFYLGAKNIYIDHELLMNETLILQDPKCKKDSEKYRLCYPSKYFDKVFDIYFSRYKLYKTYYFNLKANGVDFMIAEILKSSEPYFRFKEACSLLMEGKCDKYMKLTDSIIEKIEDACNDIKNQVSKQKTSLPKVVVEGILHAGKILHKLKRREIYDFVKEYQKSFPVEEIGTFIKVQEDLQKMIDSFLEKHDNVVLNQSEIGFGIKDKSPFSECRFYDKTKKPKTMEFFNEKYFSMLKPNGNIEISVRLYLKDRSKNPTIEEINQIDALVEEVEQNIEKIHKFDEGLSGTYTNRRESVSMTREWDLAAEKERIRKNIKDDDQEFK